MKYYKHLYLSEGLEKKKDKIIQKIEAGKILPGIFLVTLAPDEKNQLEIHRYLLLLQPVFHRENLFVVGISKDYEEALELVEELKRDKKIFTTNAIIHICEERYETVEISKLEGIIEAILFT